jgi:hypothetical protein
MVNAFKVGMEFYDSGSSLMGLDCRQRILNDWRDRRDVEHASWQANETGLELDIYKLDHDSSNYLVFVVIISFPHLLSSFLLFRELL